MPVREWMAGPMALSMISVRRTAGTGAGIRVGPARHSVRAPSPGWIGTNAPAAPDHWERPPRVAAALAFHSAEPNPLAVEALSDPDDPGAGVTPLAV